MIRQPRILLLDEATSALDVESERMVQRSLDSLMVEGKAAGRTTIVIAHRLSTVVNVDRIVVLRHGVVVEVGTPSELRDNSESYFHKMLQMQSLIGTDETTSTVGSGDGASAVKTAVNGDDVVADAEQGSSADAVVAPEADAPPVPFKRVMTYQRDQWPIMFGGFLAAVFNGMTMPVRAGGESEGEGERE